MDRLNIQAEDRALLGKKVKTLRSIGKIPAHVFGKSLDGENISVDEKGFIKTFQQAGESGLIDLKIGTEKIRPVLIRGVQYDFLNGQPIHVDFYQVNLLEKVTVPVPLELIGEQPEKVHLGEAIVLQTVSQVEVEALPTDLVDKIEVDISNLTEIDDSISVAQLNFDRSKLTINTDPEEIVVKLAPAVSAEMEELLEEQAAETAEAAAEEVAEGAEGSGEQVEKESEEESIGETANEKVADLEEKSSEESNPKEA